MLIKISIMMPEMLPIVLILKKKKEHVQEALQNNIGKPKELWKTLRRRALG